MKKSQSGEYKSGSPTLLPGWFQRKINREAGLSSLPNGNESATNVVTGDYLESLYFHVFSVIKRQTC